jgi:signal transduction histidine kinase
VNLGYCFRRVVVVLEGVQDVEKGKACWEFFKCDEKECPVYKSKELNCWLIPGTHCRNEIQGKFLEKMEMCLECEPFRANIDVNSIEETLNVTSQQFTEFRNMVEERDRELEGISMELAVSLSEVFEALREISSGNPEVRMSETSKLELIVKLKHIVNLTAENVGEIVNLSHEFAIGLAEHFDVLNRVSKGDLAARVFGITQLEILEALKKVTNQMIGTIAGEITERRRAEEYLRHYAARLERSNQKLEEFAHAISHDLQEPLRALTSYMRMLRRGYESQLDDDANRYISFAIDGANRMYDLIDRLLQDSKVDIRDKPLEPTD